MLQALFTHLPLMQALFQTTDIDAAAWLSIVAAGALVLLVVETEKVLWRRRAAAKVRTATRPPATGKA